MRQDDSPICQQFQEALEEVITKFSGNGITLGECISALEVVKLNLWLEQRRREEDIEGATDVPPEEWTPEI